MKKVFTLIISIICLTFSSFAQLDTIPIENVAVQDTITEEVSKKKPRKRVSDFRVYGGVSTTKILLSNSSYESANAAGYLLGFSYRKGRFGYWEIGVNYNNSAVSLEDVNVFEENMQIRQLEAPLTAGINVLSLTRRVLGLRLFGGIVPGYIASVEENPFNLVDDDFNRFQLSGRIGLGIDILFLFIEGGYQYGFMDVLNNQNSKLSQLDFHIGFRF